MANLKDIVKQVFRRSNHDPSPTPDAVEDMKSFVNDALQQISLDAPIMFNEDRLTIHTDPDAVASADGDTVTLALQDFGPGTGVYNTYTFQVDLPTATNGSAAPDIGQVVWTAATIPTVDAPPKQWAGRMIDIILSDGTVYTTQIRSVWLEEVEDGGDTFIYARFSVVTPWLYEVFGEGPFQYRVYTQDYDLPDDIIEIKSARVVGVEAPSPAPLAILGQVEAEAAGFADERSTAVGQPRSMFQGRHYQLPGPNIAVNVVEADADDNPWLGPEPPGTFEYVFTYCWGRRRDYSPGIAYWRHASQEWREPSSTVEPEFDRVARMRNREPMWESAPSPVSSVATVAAPDGEGNPVSAVFLGFPNIEYHLGFMLAGETSVTGLGTDFRRINVAHSGFHIRIYRRRLTANFTNYTDFGSTQDGQSITTLHRMDIQDAFYLLAEFRIDEFNEGRWLDDGQVIPDYLRRLRPVNGYRGVRLWPRPDDQYDIEVRCVRRGPLLVSDSDVPPIHPEAVKLVVDYSKALLMEKLGEPAAKAEAMGDYQRNLNTLLRRYGDLRPANAPQPRRLARAWGYNRFGSNRPRGGSE